MSPVQYVDGLIQIHPDGFGQLSCLRIARAKHLSQPLDVEHQHRFRRFVMAPCA